MYYSGGMVEERNPMPTDQVVNESRRITGMVDDFLTLDRDAQRFALVYLASYIAESDLDVFGRALEVGREIVEDMR